MTKFTLFSLLATDRSQVVTISGVRGILSAVQREDGSGSSFNVTLWTPHGYKTVHVRTVD